MEEKKSRKSILIIGWFRNCHSYAIVNINQIIGLYNNYNVYIYEYPYPDIYKNKWVSNEVDLKKKYNVFTGNQHIDLVYSITYPYIININEPVLNCDLSKKPWVVFYTAEFQELNPKFFKQNGNLLTNDSDIKSHLDNCQNIFFHTPSFWSKNSMDKYGKDSHVIPHGIRPDFFHIIPENERIDFRNLINIKYNIKPDDYLILHLGSMTGNKGIFEIIWALCELVINHGCCNFKLLLKGIKDLYDSKLFIKNYINLILQNGSDIQKEAVVNVINNNIIFIDEYMKPDILRKYYNACDLYISPYKAEGFNMTVLEALACGCNLLVSDNGSTQFFVNDIIKNSNDSGFYILPTIITKNENLSVLEYKINDLINLVKSAYKKNKQREINEIDKKKRVEYIHQEYSWKNVSEKLNKFFCEILN